MNIRLYQKSDYKTVCSWWEAHKWDCMPEDMLPEVGIIVEGYCAGFLYKTDSKLAWLEYIISNPNTDKNKRSEALDALMDKLIEIAKEQKFKAIFTSVAQPKLAQRYKDHGFIIGDKNMTNLVRIL